mgnify:CR=1 FL=1
MSELLKSDLFDKLADAILNGDTELAKEIENQILRGKDDTLDRDTILAIIKKEPGRVIRDIINSEDLDNFTCLKACSSLITHNVIEAQNKNRPLDDYPIKELYVILGRFINDGFEEGKNDFKKFVTERYKRFI